MSWRKVAGVLSVLLVIGAALGVLATLATANDLLLASAERLPALVTLAAVAVGLVAAIFLAHPSDDWLNNPYW